jgi:hypothetical protein
MIYIVILLVILLGISIYANINILKKYEIAEQYNANTFLFISDMEKIVNEMYSELKAIDRRGSFEADDEVGYFFKTLSTIITDLSQYMSNFNSNEGN